MRNRVKKNFIAMKLLDFFATTCCATSQKVSLKYFEKLGGGRQFSGTDPGKFANSQTSSITKKEQNLYILQITFVMWCYLMYSIIIIMFGWKLCSICNFIAIFLILANFATFLDHTKKNAAMRKNDD